MVRACSMHGIVEKCIKNVSGKCEGKKQLERLFIDERIILK
jgi:hypothetical protein